MRRSKLPLLKKAINSIPKERLKYRTVKNERWIELKEEIDELKQACEDDRKFLTYRDQLRKQKESRIEAYLIQTETHLLAKLWRSLQRERQGRAIASLCLGAGGDWENFRLTPENV